MSNIIDYVQRELRRMPEKPFCVVDSLVLTELAYVNFIGAVPEPRLFAKPVRIGDLYKAELFDSMFPLLQHYNNESAKGLWSVQINHRSLLFAMAATLRARHSPSSRPRASLLDPAISTVRRGPQVTAAQRLPLPSTNTSPPSSVTACGEAR